MIKRILPLLILGFFSQAGYAYDVENARRINNTCALCHGLYGQGTPGTLSPRLAGLPAKYIIKELEYYRDGVRKYPPMVVASAIKSMTDKDIKDVSEYLASIDLEKMDLPEIPVIKGDHKKGSKLFKKNCKSCHGREGEGKPKKGAPRIAGQYASYIFSQISKFKAKERHHDDDPDDETFDDFDKQELESIVAHLTHLTKEKQQKRRQLAATQVKDTGMTAMAAMVGMAGVKGKDGKVLTCTTDCNEENEGYAGSFKVTSRGEIILSPAQKDLRLIAGLQGRFKISKTGGLEFHPDSNNNKEDNK